MSTLAVMRANVFVKMSQGQGEIFSGDEVDIMIQREREHIHTEINMKNDDFLGKQVTFATAGTGALTSTTPYTWPTDFDKLLMMEHKKFDRWAEVPMISVHHREAYRHRRNWLYNEVDLYFYIVGSNFFLVPDIIAEGADNMRLIYLYVPAALSDDDDEPTEIPKNYHELLEIGATNRLRRASKEPPIELEEYNTKLLQLTETVSPQVKHKPKQVRMIAGGLY